MKEMKITAIGEVQETEGVFAVRLRKEYREGLLSIEGFSYLEIIWWAHRYDDEQRKTIVIDRPYKKGPEKIGVFATRSEIRPNPIAITPVYVIRIDHEEGIIYTPWIDADPGSMVLDIKPYHPSMNIVSDPAVPDWSSHWPASIEESASFDWEAEFNF